MKDKPRNFVAKHAHLAGRAGVHDKSNKAKRKGKKMELKKALRSL